MQSIILQDVNETWLNLLPLTYTKPISSLRIGIDTIREKWEYFLNQHVQIETVDYLMPKFEPCLQKNSSYIIINSSIIPSKELADTILSLNENESLEQEDLFIAGRYTEQINQEIIEYKGEMISVNHPWHLFQYNDIVFEQDFTRITQGRQSQPIPDSNQVVQPERIFIEEGGSVECSVLNASTGSIYIAKHASIMEGCVIRGGLALCEGASLKMATKHYGTSTIGPHCKVGGEINNVVFQSYSNKGHDGFLGNAVIGEWCNLGADTNASNLKNNYGLISAWNYKEEKLVNTELQFMGLIMGDHAKCAINTMFNTATIVGVAANVFGAGFPKKFLPSFTWGGVDMMRTFTLSKTFEMAKAMMSRRKVEFTQIDEEILTHIFNETKKYRNQ